MIDFNLNQLVKSNSISLFEKDELLQHLDQLLDLLDDASIKDLMKGSGGDIDKLFDVLVGETYEVINLKKYKETNFSSLSNLPNLKIGYEEYLRKINLNYFVHSVLPSFEMNWHNIEWFNMVQLYRLLCIEAARDHCFGEDTKVRMYDGSIKSIQDIKPRDLVMGPDSTARKVLSVHSGQDQLLQVKQTRGDSYVVKRGHILCGYKPHSWDEKYIEPRLLEDSVERLLTYSKDRLNSFRGYKVCIHYPERKVQLDPYFLGLWLGDGTSINQEITSIDREIIDYIKKYAEELGCLYNCTKDGLTHKIVKQKGVYRNRVLSSLKFYSLLSNKHIPKDYLLNSKENRLKLLAGLVDSDGSVSDNIIYYTTIKEGLCKDIKNLADSLGFRTYYRKCVSYNRQLKRDYTTFEVTISGMLDEVPSLLSRKTVIFNHKGSSFYKPKSFNGYDISVISSLKVTPLEIGAYYGFECDGDNRFVLEDGTVVHNSKSYSFSFAYVLWRLYRYTRTTQLITPPDEIRYYKEGMIITNEFKLAKKLLKKVKEEIQVNDILKEVLFPDKSFGVWANESITCKNGAEVTLSSFRTSNRGPHPGWIVVDDFLDKSAIYSKEQREKFIEVFNAEIMNMILPQGQVIAVGTPFHEKDLYANLKESPLWRVFEYPAVFPDGSLLWENRYNFEALKNKRITLGSMIFSREILVRPVSDSTSIFPWSSLEQSFINMGNFRLVENLISYPVKFKKVGCGVDLALSGSVGADYTVIIVLGLDELNRYHLLHITRLHGASYNQQIATLQRINNNFRPSTILMETNGFQRVMSGLAKEAGMTNIVEFTTTANTKKDLYNGLPSLAVIFERGEMKFPRGDEKSIELTNLICSELNSIAFDDDKGTLESVSEHDDTAMSLFLAVKAMKYINNNIFIDMV